ncbi:hypothetical protein QBC46DRAFT_267879, partial [Diplogelasinospora grovesii]
VVDELQPNFLLGNDFLKTFKSSINYFSYSVTFHYLNFTVDFKVQARTLPYVRKVTTLCKINLMPS